MSSSSSRIKDTRSHIIMLWVLCGFSGSKVSSVDHDRQLRFSSLCFRLSPSTVVLVCFLISVSCLELEVVLLLSLQCLKMTPIAVVTET